MKELTPTAWIVIILFVGMIIGTNLSLFLALRNRNRKSSPSRPNRTLEIIKNPWEAEDRDWNKLSEKVKNLSEPKSDEITQEQSKE